MKKKIDLFWYWFIFVVAFVLCFFAINDKKVNAYHLNEEGNLVSDNLVNLCDYGTYSSNGINPSINSNCTYDINGTATDTWSNISTRVSLVLEPGEYTFSLSSEQNFNFYTRINFEDGTNYIVQIDSQTTSRNFTLSKRGTSHYFYIGNLVVGESYFSENLGVSIIKGHDKSYEPYGTWYSEDNLNKAKEESYNEGYDKGYVDNNSIPTIYLDKAYTYYYAISPIDGSQFVMVLDTMSFITNFNATLNFSKFISIDWGNNVSSRQYMDMNIELLTELSVNDTIKINFNDISNATNFNENFYISFGNVFDCSSDYSTCTTGVYLTYQDLLNNNFEIVLKEFNPNLTVTSIDYIGMNYRYQDGFMYGVTEIIDNTLVADSDTSYDIGYKVGYINGNSVGLVEGESIGYDKGYNEGYRKASQVVKDPGNNTLVGMVSVLMGMPVNMLVSIYDFDFLGINLAEFFFSLITLLVSIWLIKKLL